MTSDYDPSELEGFADAESALIWGVEIEFDGRDKSIFRSAQRVMLDGECVQIQTLDGSFEAFPIRNVRKILSMRAERPQRYTDEELSSDEIY